MNSLQDSRRQLRVALFNIAILIPVGVIGFMVLEHFTFLEAFWLTIITLGTIGYGDIYARTDVGRLFTIGLILVGLSAFAFGLQATASFFYSPALQALRQRRREQKKIDALSGHYIITGVGELADRTIRFLLQGVQSRQDFQSEQLYQPVDRFLDSILGDDARGHYPRTRAVFRRLFLLFVKQRIRRDKTVLDSLVVITEDPGYADSLRETGIFVVIGDPTNDEALKHAGIERAQAIMVALENDNRTLLTLMTARDINHSLYLTAVATDEEITRKMIRVGANSVIAAYDVASQFLNNATLRPAVYEFFNSVMFNQKSGNETLELHVGEGSLWAGQRLGSLRLRENYNAGVLGLRLETGEFIYVPSDDTILNADQIIIVVAPIQQAHLLQKAGSSPPTGIVHWQRLPMHHVPVSVTNAASSTDELDSAIRNMSHHFVMCGSGRVIKNSISKLDPSRPFVIITNDESYADTLLDRGFRVVYGDPTNEKVLRRAGVDRALAIMIDLSDEADSVLTTLNSRSLSKHVLITAVSNTEAMKLKLQRAGADRVTSPFEIGAQFVTLATLRPAVSDFLQYVVYNRQAGIETTELYMQDNSPWIGKTIEELLLDRLFRAGVIGLRLADGQYTYAPHQSHELRPYEVLIVVTPMVHSDELRLTAHGSSSRPKTLRTPVSNRVKA